MLERDGGPRHSLRGSGLPCWPGSLLTARRSFPSDFQQGKLLVLLRFEQLSIYIIVRGTSANAGGDADR